MAVHELPSHLAAHVPLGHRLFWAPTQGALRMDWVLCVCGLGVKIEATEQATDQSWFQAVNQCRLAERLTLLTEQGTFVEPPPLAPPRAEPAKAETPKKNIGRPKKKQPVEA